MIVTIKVADIKKGDVLGENVISPLGGKLLLKDTILDEYYKKMLLAFEVVKVPVVRKDKTALVKKEKPEEKTMPKIISGAAEFEKDFISNVKLIKKISLEAAYTKKIPIMDVRMTLKPLLEKIIERPELSLHISYIKIPEDPTYIHMVSVAVFSTVIARFMSYKDNELMQIGLAGMLHDIGKAEIPDSILKKANKLTVDEFNEMSRHTSYGYDMLKNIMGINQGVVIAALEHHEREDGSGYPNKRQGYEIHPYSKIVAVADELHMLTKKEDGKENENIYQALKKLSDRAYGKLDPLAVNKVINGLFSFCLGKKVELSDGSVGEIIFVNSNMPLKPLIRVDKSFVDLNRRSDIDIVDLMLH